MFKKRTKSAEEILQQQLSIPTAAEDKRYSAVFSMNRQPGRASHSLLSNGLVYANDALFIDLTDVSARIKNGTNYIDIYPGSIINYWLQ